MERAFQHRRSTGRYLKSFRCYARSSHSISQHRYFLSTMEQNVPTNPSRVPSHLKPFLRPSLTTEPVVTQDNAPGIEIQPSKPVELCPPHWRLEPKRSFGKTLKSLILKEWPLPKPTTPPRNVSSGRPSMRMKDSDDYITARAANPRTGLISPSVGTLTPRLLDTPDSPGEALHIRAHELPASPTPGVKERPALKRANEGRKISAGSNKMWKPDDCGWLMEEPVTKASPRFTDAQVAGDLLAAGGRSHANEDLLVLHMPSAQEPQPFAYPGYSSKQIEAAEFYKRKARRGSSEGYDKRILHGSRQCSAESKASHSGGIRKVSFRKPCQKAVSSHHTQFRETESPVYHGGHIIVAKRRVGRHEFDNTDVEDDCRAGADLHATTFAPFRSPKTPMVRDRDDTDKEMHASQAPRYCDVQNMHSIHRKPVSTQQGSSICHGNDLKSLPQIALIHPAFAALPRSHPHRQRQDPEGERKCSFGCVKDPDSDVCVERRTPSTSLLCSGTTPLFDQRNEARSKSFDGGQEGHDEQAPPPFLEHLAVASISIFDACRSVIAPLIPRITAMDALRADQTPQQKLAAMKQLLATAGQAMVFVAIAATLWRVGSAVVQISEIVFWPIIVPFRIVGWLGGLGG